MDIKKFYCRAGIKSIQVCLQGSSGLATFHELPAFPNSLWGLEARGRDLGSVPAESCVHIMDKTVKLNGIQPSSAESLEGTFLWSDRVPLVSRVETTVLTSDPSSCTFT